VIDIERGLLNRGWVMANAEHEKFFQGNITCWNEWRKAHLEILPDLSTAVFENLDLTGINLSQVDLRGAVFRNCVLKSANFESANLTGATFSGITSAKEASFLYAVMRENEITNCKWHKVCFNNTDISATSIVECEFDNCELLSTNLMGVNWSNCLLSNCNLEDATLRVDHFDPGAAGLSGNTMQSCILTNADFAGADLRGLVGHQFDHNNIQGTLMAPRAPDEWSVLRRAYTGTRLFFNLIFLACFFAPVVAKTVFWMEVSRLEAQFPVAVSTMNRLADKLETTPGEIGAEMAEALRRAVATAPVLRKESSVDQLLPFWLAAQQLRTDPGTLGRLLGAGLEASLVSSAPARNARQLIEQVADELATRPEAEAKKWQMLSDAQRRHCPIACRGHRACSFRSSSDSTCPGPRREFPAFSEPSQESC
jgi:uncharacterized protein YjbI with pentapeptide repeats